MKKLINLSPKELVSLSSSLAIFLYERYDIEDLQTIRQFLSATCSNISLLEQQCKKQKNTK